MGKKPYVKKEVIEEYVKKYPGAEKSIRKTVELREKTYENLPHIAVQDDFKIYIEEIKDFIPVENPLGESFEGNIDIKNIKKEELDILKFPELFKEITEKELNKKIVREYGVRKAIFLCANGRLVKNSQIASYNLLVNDEAGAGKDYITSKVLEILPQESYIKKTRISPAVFTYWHNSKFEPDWTWDGKVFYTEDISESVLNSEVFKVMCSSGSSATIVIKQRAIEMDIQGKPVIITTTATSTPNPELTRRFEIVNLDESIDQTTEIMKRHCKYAMEGISPEYSKTYSTAMSHLKRVNVKIPFAESLYLIFPPESIMMRTKFPRFLDFIKASAAFHQFQRKWENKDTILAEKQDYEIACDVMEKISSNKYLVSLTKRQRRIMEYMEKQTEKEPNFAVSASKIRQGMRNFISLTAIITNLSQLASYGILETKLEENEHGKELELYSVSPNILKGIHTISFPTFEYLQKLNEERTKPTKPIKVTKPIKLTKVNPEDAS